MVVAHNVTERDIARKMTRVWLETGELVFGWDNSPSIFRSFRLFAVPQMFAKTLTVLFLATLCASAIAAEASAIVCVLSVNEQWLWGRDTRRIRT